MPMHPAIKKEWVEELRSGRFHQGKGKLKQEVAGNVTHCCLGVLGEICVRHGMIAPPVKMGTDYELETGTGMTPEGYREVYGYRTPVGTYDMNVLPHKVMYWAGLRVADPYVSADSEVKISLSVLNDDGATFAQIATYIENDKDL